ncbi:ribosomal protein L35 family member protein [Theileria equi strain WA]|uniref:50S ribosomal protein L35 n=1 Tax=Theileria equi strain WA TaxID=1537102 RepID=L0AX93_THEEQ|nr:ribosomal protein L35 family member protein [Theileria equi strain WA]AFZ80202.1 ribosomal protein L35 family member protein [Theileria equi strain WA]|eukprot:XP_004829868.1 ribosomal protein L35 family member protein [Theileria equi strain WA]
MFFGRWMIIKSLLLYIIVSLVLGTATASAKVVDYPIPGNRNGIFQAFLSHIDWIPKVQRDLQLFERRKVKLKLRAAGQFRIKPKTNKSVSKRFKITATGKIMYKRANRHHLQRKKNRGAKARTKRAVCIKSTRIIRKIKSVLHNR